MALVKFLIVSNALVFVRPFLFFSIPPSLEGKEKMRNQAYRKQLIGFDENFSWYDTVICSTRYISEYYKRDDFFLLKNNQNQSNNK